MPEKGVGPFLRQLMFVIALPQRGQMVPPPTVVVPQLEHWLRPRPWETEPQA